MEVQAFMKYRAVFFDRDNTLLHKDPALEKEWMGKIARWSGKEPPKLSYEQMMALFARAGYPQDGLKSVESEIAFWKRYYYELLLENGVEGQLEARAEELHQMTWLKGYQLYPETLKMLDWCRAQGLRMGVISDTSPSLPLTLEAAGIGGYFQCAICSSLVGVMKPDPKIYQTALDALGVTAEESIYVDDYDVEADGARAMGFTAFHIDRTQPGDGEWRISSLLEIKTYLERSQR